MKPDQASLGGQEPPTGTTAPGGGPSEWPPPHARHGLTAQQVDQRVAEGRVNAAPQATSRSVSDIVKTNLFTRFNFLIGGLLIVILIVAPIQDALFGIVAISNLAIGIVQELRAKRSLDKLALVHAPTTRVLRDGSAVEIDPAQIVVDDVLQVSAGDQMPVDGLAISSEGLEMDESLVTGESDRIDKGPRDQVLSGSFAVAGSGWVVATEVGAESFAGKLASQAREFTMVQSELRNGIDRILVMVTWVLIPTAILLLVSQLRQDQSVADALAGAVAGTVAMVPEGLVLLTSVAFALAVVRLARQEVLVQELPAVETLARVDTIAFDKTGTLTTGDIQVADAVVLDGAEAPEDIEAALTGLAGNEENPNATMLAITDAGDRQPSWTRVDSVPFSSARKWSAATFAGHGTWVLGAPDVLIGALAEGDADAGSADSNHIRGQAESLAATGQRVLLLARSEQQLAGAELPVALQAQALLSFAEDVRDDAKETVNFFRDQGVRPMVISGDHPRTVAAVAGRVGVEGADKPLGGRHIPTDPEAAAYVVEDRSVYGRVTPQQKHALVEGLQSHDHVVAMTGDGVNDVLALKTADIGIAVGDAAAASRSVSQLVLLNGQFSALPHIIAEGRRVIANIEKVAKLFVSKTVYASVLAIAIGVMGMPFPFLPRHLSFAAGLTIGFPGFLLALERSAKRATPGFVRRTLVFAVPAGLAAAGATFASYWLAQDMSGVSLAQSRTTATITLFGMGTVILYLLSRPLTRARRGMLYLMVTLFVGAFVVPPIRIFFALELPPLIMLLAAVGIVAIAGLAMQTVVHALSLYRQAPELTGAAKELLRQTFKSFPRRGGSAEKGRAGRHSTRPGDQ